MGSDEAARLFWGGSIAYYEKSGFSKHFVTCVLRVKYETKFMCIEFECDFTCA